MTLQVVGMMVVKEVCRRLLSDKVVKVMGKRFGEQDKQRV